ncbi:hypothetical protein RHMOL_Rhmol12G0011200 [Rhododendron molle]|uniref:Uncharacterized protein n=1 Tax=Rhododendron molle TaxID=49168 RepID=A0ACC0LE51_RHOML|nr:hypothetical protein RHMOL_Rhmol12G0011200 [Rhododendron molle]
MSHRRRDDSDEELEREEDEEEALDEEEGKSGRKRRRSEFIDDVAEEDEDEEEEEEDGEFYDGGGRRRRGGDRHKKRAGSLYIDEYAKVDSDGEEDDDDGGEEDFIVDHVTDLQDEDDVRRMHCRSLSPREDDQEDVEALERSIQARYARLSHTEYDEETQETTDVEQQALLPSVRDPKFWMVKCKTGHEREAAVCLMQKYLDKGSELQIRSAIALDHLKDYIYVEADKEAHVKEACKGMRLIHGNTKITLVPIKEMTDVVSVKSKAIDLSRDTLVRVKKGDYKGDLAKVVDVDNVQQRVTVKLIPRIDLHALANKLEEREVPNKKGFVPPARFMNVDEAREMRIRVERRFDPMTGDYFENIGGMMFKDGFLYKNVSMKSISTQNIQPTFDEFEKFRQPVEHGDGDMASLSTVFANRKKCHFMKGDQVIIVKGDLKNLKGWVEKVDEDNVHIRSNAEGLPKTLAVNEKELCKYFEPGNHVKVVCGASEGATGMVIKVEGHVVIIVSDTTKEDIRVFADNVAESSEVTAGVTRTGGYELHDLGVGRSRGNGKRNGDTLASRFSHLRTPTHVPQSLGKLPRGTPWDSGARHRGGRGHDPLVGTTVKVCQGPFKGYRGRVVDFKGSSVRIELESKVVAGMFTYLGTFDRHHISDNTAVSTPYRSGTGSETPMHPSRTPLHPYMTPMRDPEATPIHDGMRTPMRDRAWNPYTPMSPPRDKWENANPGSWGTSPQYQPGSPPSRRYEAPTPGSGWANTPSDNYGEAGTPRANAPSPYLPSTPGGHPMTPSSASYLPDTPGWQPMTPGRDGLDVMSPAVGGDDEGLRALPDILVNVRRSGEDTVIGVVRDVLSDGSCRINLGLSGDGDTVIALSSQIDLVVPGKSDKVKIMSGALRGSTGKLIGVDGSDGIVKQDATFEVRIVEINILAKVAQS